MTAPTAPRAVIGVSLKMYFSHAQTVQWCRDVADVLAQHPVVHADDVEFFVVPSALSLEASVAALEGRAGVGVQDVSVEAFGARTGDTSAAVAAELGARYAEIGHAERRAMYGETDEIVGAKVLTAAQAGLTPIICVGEAEQGSPSEAIDVSVRQIDAALAPLRAEGLPNRVIVAYEPIWAIGAASAASVDHIRAVCAGLRAHLRDGGDVHSRVIYGGSAGPGLLLECGDSVDGLFLGRRAHDPAAVARILDEVAALPSAS